MLDFFLDLIQVNEKIDYAMLVSIIITYLFIIWFVVSIWVFADARKRYSSIITPFLFTIFIIFFGPPALIFYILIRPEHTLEEDYYMSMAMSGGKESRPIQFNGDDGFDIAINLSVKPKQSQEKSHQMLVDVEWNPQPIDRKKMKKMIHTQKKRSTVHGVKSIGSKVYSKIKYLGSRFVIREETSSDTPSREEKIEDDENVEESPISIKIKKEKRKRRKKRKKKKFDKRK